MPSARHLSLLLLLSIAALADTAEAVVAVFPPVLEGAGASGVDQALVDGLQARLADRGVVVVERERILAAVAEQALGAGGAIDAASAAKFGRLLGAEMLVLGSVRGGGPGKVSAVLRGVRTADGAIVWAGTAEGTAGEVAGQAAGFADGLTAALAKPPAPITGERVGLVALRHRERAQALIAQRAYADAAAESLLALRLEPGSEAALIGWIQSLADGGFPELAAAEATAAIAAGKAKEDTRLRGWAKAPPAAPARPATTPKREPGLEERSHQAAIALLERLAAGANASEADAAAADLVDAWARLGELLAGQGRDRAALEANAAAAVRGWQRHARRRNDDNFGNGNAWKRGPLPANLRPLPLLAALSANAHVGDDLATAVADAIAAGGLPREASASVPAISGMLRLTPADSAIIPGADRGDSDLILLRFDLSRIPAGTTVIAALLEAGAVAIQEKPRVVRQSWIGSEADAHVARRGVPWVPHGEFMSRPGRAMPLGNDEPLVRAVRRQMAAGADAHGIAMGRHGKFDPAAVTLLLTLAGTVPGLEPDPRSLVEQAVLALLAGRKAEARAGFDRARAAGARGQGLDRLTVMCGETK